MKNENYYSIHDAFKSLEVLLEEKEEAIFSLRNGDEVEEAGEFLKDTENSDELEVIVDPEAETEEDLKDSYVGYVILKCKTCGTPIFKPEDEIKFPEDQEVEAEEKLEGEEETDVVEEAMNAEEEIIVNEEEECPHCHDTAGFVIVGKVAPFETAEPEAEEEPVEEPQPEEEPVEEVEKESEEIEETEEEEIEESCEKCEEGKECPECEEKKSKPLPKRAEKEEKSLTEEPNEGNAEWQALGYEPRGFYETEIKKNPDNWEVTSKYVLHGINNETFNEKGYCTEQEFEGSAAELRKAQEKLFNDNEKVDDIVVTKLFINKENGKEVWVDMDKYMISRPEMASSLKYAAKRAEKKDEKLEEAKLRYNIELIGWPNSADAIVAIRDADLEPEDFEECILNCEDNEAYGKTKDGRYFDLGDGWPGRFWEITEKEYIEARNEVLRQEGELEESHFNFEEICENKLDSLINKYLKETYDNVESYTTNSMSEDNKKIYCEGVIKFKSGKERNTTFVFENARNLTKGKVVLSGLNEMFSKSAKAFQLKGVIEENKFNPESLTYQYNAKSLNESVKVFGKVKN